MFEQFTARMWGVYPEEGFPAECHALFSTEEAAKEYIEARAEEYGNGWQVLSTDVAAALWNDGIDDHPAIQLDGAWLRRFADAEDNSVNMGWPILDDYSEPEPTPAPASKSGEA